MGTRVLGRLTRGKRRPLIFVDSSGWIAVNVSGDKDYAGARSFYQQQIFSKYRQLVTTNLVLAETHAYLLRRGGRKNALKFLSLVNDSARVRTISSSPELETAAVSLLSRFHDQDFSLCDAVSFVLMHEMNIRDAFCFDKHFQTAGFRNLPAE